MKFARPLLMFGVVSFPLLSLHHLSLICDLVLTADNSVCNIYYVLDVLSIIW